MPSASADTRHRYRKFPNYKLITCLGSEDTTKKWQHRWTEPGIEQVQTLTDISHLALCSHTNETSAPIANPPNSAQLEDTPTTPSSYIWVHAVLWECGEGQTDRQTHGRLWPIYILPRIYASREMYLALTISGVRLGQAEPVFRQHRWNGVWSKPHEM